MNRAITILCVFAILFSLCACKQEKMENRPVVSDISGLGKSTSDRPSTSSETGVSQQKKEAGRVVVQIIPPEGWEKNEGSVLPIHYRKDTASFLVKTEPFAGATLDEVVTEALGIYQKTFDNVRIIGEPESSTIDGKDARILTFTCSISKLNMKYLYVYLFAADQCYVITFGDLENKFDMMATEYKTILNNIRFVTE